MIEELTKLVDKTIESVDLKTVDQKEVVKDLVEASRFFAFRMLVGSRLLEKALQQDEGKKPVQENGEQGVGS